MDEAQIEQMRQLAAGGAGGAAPSERKDDPAVLTKLAATLVEDDAVLVLAELVAAAASRPGGSGASTLHTAARVLLSMATTPEARGKIVAQGGFKALLTCALCEHEPTATSAAWALAKVGISINPVAYPRRPGSGPESMVKPLLRLVDGAEHELQQFEACLALCNLATHPELQQRILTCGGWRTLTMSLACENELVQRAALEAMSNLTTADEVAAKFAEPGSTEAKIFVGFCGSDDPKAQLAASGADDPPPPEAATPLSHPPSGQPSSAHPPVGAMATLAGDPEIGSALLGAGALEPLVNIALLSDDPPLLHRAAVGLANLFNNNADAILGPAAPTDQSELPGPALTAVGALITLSSSPVEPAKAAAVGALVQLRKTRPDVPMPPAEVVQAVVANIRAEHAARVAEAEAAAAAEAEAAAEAAAKAGAGGSKEAAEALLPRGGGDEVEVEV